MPAHQVSLTISALTSGIALLVTLYSGLPLSVSLLCLGLGACSFATLIWLRLPQEGQQTFRQRALVGLLAGFAATVGYDVVRWLLVKVGSLSLAPFDTWRLFGELIVGNTVSQDVQFLVGVLYHFLNGMLFTVAYALLLGHRDWKYGILWALGLEAIALMVYPGWLDLQGIMDEFISVSLAGHITYGTILGRLTNSLLLRFSTTASTVGME